MKDAESDVDMLDARAVETHFNRFGKAILEDAGPLAGKTLSHFYSVSWEGAIPTWTFGFRPGFPEIPRLFAAALSADSRRADHPIAGRFPSVFSAITAGRWSDCFMNNCYSKLGELCHRAGLQWHSESGGPWRRDTLLFAQADALAFWGRNDMPQGEFWWPGIRRSAAATASRRPWPPISYGRPLVSMESFTHMVPHWSAYPAALKPGADAAFCDGINRFVWHTFSASPPEFGKPGIVYFAGTHLNPNVTWWEQAGGLLSHLGRCQSLLQQGRFQADVCCYRSDKNYADWNRGPKAVNPSFGLPQGYAYDLVNTEALLERFSVKDWKLVLPDGMCYRLLVVDPEEESLPPEALRKILKLVREGATVVLGPTTAAAGAGATNYPACDQEVRAWRPSSGSSGLSFLPPAAGQGQSDRRYGSRSGIAREGILPDCTGPWDYTHRRFGDWDVYFLAGTGRGNARSGWPARNQSFGIPIAVRFAMPFITALGRWQDRCAAQPS